MIQEAYHPHILGNYVLCVLQMKHYAFRTQHLGGHRLMQYMPTQYVPGGVCVDSGSGNQYFYMHHDGIRTDIPSDRITQAVAASHGQFQLYTTAWQECIERLELSATRITLLNDGGLAFLSASRQSVNINRQR